VSGHRTCTLSEVRLQILGCHLGPQSELRSGCLGPVPFRLPCLCLSGVARHRQGGYARPTTQAGLAGVELECGQAERAARLLGAIDATRESVGIEHIKSWLHAERIANDTRTALEAATFGRACLAGRTAPLEEAIVEALAIADEMGAGTTL
jgi:hypothetical protein